jgi:chromosomal replication initiator protein
LKRVAVRCYEGAGGQVELNEAFWNLIKDRIKARNTENKSLETWLNPVSFVEVAGTADLPRVILGVPNDLSQYFVVENLLEKIYCEISEVYLRPFEVDVIVKRAASPESLIETPVYSENQFEPSRVIHNQAQMLASQQSRPHEILNKDSLNNEYTFSTFVVGRNTEFAHAASFNVARNPGMDGYNPLFICGPVGMGKTHLLHAVGNHIRSNIPHLRIQYISAERFLNEFLSALRREETEKFRAKYRDGSDILLVDDVQMIGRGQATQDEFFHVINSFLERKKQVVLASDRMPKDIINLEDRNRSRLEWGLIADISMPDFETRVAILRYKAERFNVRMTEEVINYIARISKRSIREIEGNLKKIKMFSELSGVQIDISLAKQVLAHHETQTSISIEDIQKLVADHFKVRITDLKSPTRAKQIVVPRQISMYLIKKHLDKSLVDIGRAFGGKDHTTVMNALDRVGHLQSIDVDIKNDIEELTTRIHNITGV